MRASPALASALARLLAWDAPFLPVVAAATEERGSFVIELLADGVPVRATLGWPRARRAAVAVQVVAAVEFLFERGWFIGRRSLWAARVTRSERGDHLRLADLPRLRLGDHKLDGRLRTLRTANGDPRPAVLAPLLKALVPERWPALSEVLARDEPWRLGGGLLGVLSGDGRTTGALRHAMGPGRALWARHLALPERGVVFVEDDSTLAAATSAARLAAAATRGAAVFAGPLDETEVARAQAGAAAAERDAVVLTSLPVAGAELFAITGGEGGVWVFGIGSALAREHATAATELSAGRAELAGEALSPGAAACFSTPPPVEIATRRTEHLTSSAARAALRWIGLSPVGLDDGELASLGGREAQAALGELERLRLVACRDGRWSALARNGDPDAERLQTMLARLPRDSWARSVAVGSVEGDWTALEELCERALSAGAAKTTLAVAAATPATAAIRLAGAEAALEMGRLADCERFLDGVANQERNAEWHALAAWWAEQAGLPSRAKAELAQVGGASLPERIAARAGLARAELAHREGNLSEELQHLRIAVERAPAAVPEARLLLAVAEGGTALRRLWREEARGWPDDVRARALHLLGYGAMERGSLAAAGTAMRAALRAASGSNPRVLGEIHADLGKLAVECERQAAAERHLLLADRFLERCGSRRAVTVVRYNRGVVANDRLDWLAARELILAARDLRGRVVDSTYWLEELELVRCLLARGDGAATRAALPGVAAGVAQHGVHEVLGRALAALRAHLALSDGDVSGALVAAQGADASESALIVAVARADEGDDPQRSLPTRWGVVVTARALACWQRSDLEGARMAIAAALERSPREGAVALVRLAAILEKRGERLDESWVALRRLAEEALVAASLDGWSARLRGLFGLDAELLVRAVDAIAGAGPDGLRADHLEPLARVLGLVGIEVRRHGVVGAAWGAQGEAAEEVADGPVRVRFDGACDAVGRAVAELIATLAASSAVPRVEAGSGAAASILGGSSATAALRAEVARWAPLPTTVLILGEPGTGKELVARELHRASGRKGAFVPVNCAGIPATLLEAELFGVVRGAYTGADRDRQGLVEAAERGTLFLDEIGEMPLELQAKLLRLLQDGEVRRVGATTARAVDVRFVAATNRDLKTAVATSSFRQDLYYRLVVAVVTIPPLRERPDDVDELARHFVSQYAEAFNRPGVRLTPSALTALRAARWPGNVRELDSAIARAVAIAGPGEAIAAERFADLEPAVVTPPALLSWTAAVEAFRRGYFTAVLRATGGNRSEAARRAGLSRQALLYHLRHLGKLEE